VTAAAIHQLLPTFNPRDAVGNNTVELARLLREMGHESRIFATNIHPELARDASPVDHIPDDDAWLIYHHSIGSAAGDSFERRAGRRILVYHNITPLELVERWAPEVGAEILLGREQTQRYASLTDVAVADSDYNRSELDALGYPRTTTIPVMFEPGRLEHSTRHKTSASTRLLFVGRLAPNKAQHELVAMLSVLRDTTDPNTTLHLVGSRTFGSYADALLEYIDDLGLGEAVFVHEGVTDTELAAHYAAADVFVCVSDHEGFCVPVIEAMHHGVPVVAYDSSAVGGTVGNAGLVLGSKSPDHVAAAVARVIGDPHLRAQMIAAGKRRADDFELSRSREAWSSLISALDPAL